MVLRGWLQGGYRGAGGGRLGGEHIHDDSTGLPTGHGGTATGWERAAIVAAFVQLPGRGSRATEERRTTFFTAEEFATLGIGGLKSDRTIRIYVQA